VRALSAKVFFPDTLARLPTILRHQTFYISWVFELLIIAEAQIFRYFIEWAMSFLAHQYA
jgi:hypothetical protein